MRIGHGFDLHRLEPGKPLYLASLQIPHTHGALAHSDGDVVIHALCDALLGAMAQGDIGMHFPDTDPQWKGAASRVFLQRVKQMLDEQAYVIANIDLTVLAEAPKLRPHIDLMRAALADIVVIPVTQISIKATTMEGLGAIGEAKAIACHAMVLLDGSAR